MKPLAKLGATVSLLLTAETVLAQASCMSSSAADFLALAFSDEALNAQSAPEAVQETSTSALNAARTLPTSALISGTSTASTIANFLPMFSLSGLAGDLFGDSQNSAGSDDALAFDFNTSFGGTDPSERQFKFQVAFDRDPSIYDALVDSLPSDERDAFRSSAQQELTLTDDATFSITYNVQNEALGRNRRLLGQIFNAAIGSVSSTELQARLDDLSRVVDTVSTTDQTTDIANLSMTDAQKQALCDQLTAAADALRDAAQAMNDAENLIVNDIQIERFAKLIHNQPQLNARASFRERNSLIGADEASLSINFEWGYAANVNKVQAFIDAQCGVSATRACLLDSFRRYLAANSSAIDSGDRLRFSLEYTDIDELSVMLENPIATFAKPGAEKLTAAFAYGRSLPVTSGLFDSSRIDFEIKREDIDNDPDRNNRTIGTITLTRSLGDLAFPISIVYANKPEFLSSMVDSEVSAHIGIKYEFSEGRN